MRRETSQLGVDERHERLERGGIARPPPREQLGHISHGAHILLHGHRPETCDLGIPERLLKNITLKYDESGHMMYLRDEDRVALRDNLIAFIDNGLGQW
jgi:hypothetical protein